jgi:hypothetical protein
MRKRLRKKLRKGEFQEMGFEVQFNLPSHADQEQQNAFFDSFIQEAIEKNGLMCGGGCGLAWNVFVTRNQRGTATQSDREIVRSWLERRPEVSGIQFGPLTDAWYSV